MQNRANYREISFNVYGEEGWYRHATTIHICHFYIQLGNDSFFHTCGTLFRRRTGSFTTLMRIRAVAFPAFGFWISARSTCYVILTSLCPIYSFPTIGCNVSCHWVGCYPVAREMLLMCINKISWVNYFTLKRILLLTFWHLYMQMNIVRLTILFGLLRNIFQCLWWRGLIQTCHKKYIKRHINEHDVNRIRCP